MICLKIDLIKLIQWLENNLFTCYFKSHFGIECPGCGLQRSLIALLKGDFIQSIYYNPALIPLLITFLLLLIQLFTKKVYGGKLVMWAFIITCFILVVNYFLKTIL
jgi:hypothetical protein